MTEKEILGEVFDAIAALKIEWHQRLREIVEVSAILKEMRHSGGSGFEQSIKKKFYEIEKELFESPSGIIGERGTFVLLSIAGRGAIDDVLGAFSEQLTRVGFTLSEEQNQILSTEVTNVSDVLKSKWDTEKTLDWESQSRELITFAESLNKQNYGQKNFQKLILNLKITLEKGMEQLPENSKFAQNILKEIYEANFAEKVSSGPRINLGSGEVIEEGPRSFSLIMLSDEARRHPGVLQAFAFDFAEAHKLLETRVGEIEDLLGDISQKRKKIKDGEIECILSPTTDYSYTIWEEQCELLIQELAHQYGLSLGKEEIDFLAREAQGGIFGHFMKKNGANLSDISAENLKEYLCSEGVSRYVGRIVKHPEHKNETFSSSDIDNFLVSMSKIALKLTEQTAITNTQEHLKKILIGHVGRAIFDELHRKRAARNTYFTTPHDTWGDPQELQEGVWKLAEQAVHQAGLMMHIKNPEGEKMIIYNMNRTPLSEEGKPKQKKPRQVRWREVEEEKGLLEKAKTNSEIVDKYRNILGEVLKDSIPYKLLKHLDNELDFKKTNEEFLADQAAWGVIWRMRDFGILSEQDLPCANLVPKLTRPINRLSDRYSFSQEKRDLVRKGRERASRLHLELLYKGHRPIAMRKLGSVTSPTSRQR